MNTYIHKKYPILSVEHPAESFAMRAGVGFLILFSCLYLYFVSASVLNVMARSQAERATVTLEGEVGTLQQEYFALVGDISAESASALGLAPVVDTSYVHRPGLVGVVSSEYNAI